MKTCIKTLFVILCALSLISGVASILIAVAAEGLSILSIASVIVTLISMTTSAATLILAFMFVGNKFIRVIFLITLIALLLSIIAAIMIFI